MTGALQRVFVLLRWVLLWHRAPAVLLTAYVGFFVRLWEARNEPHQASPFQVLVPSQEFIGSSLLADVSLEPLAGAKKPDVLVRRDDRGVRLQRQRLVAEAARMTTENEEDAADILGRALRSMMGSREAQQQVAYYVALGNAHSAKGRYVEAVRAADLSVRVALDSGDRALLAFAHTMAGQLELRHQRYATALTRLDEADMAMTLALSVNTLSSLHMRNGSRAAILSSAGWAAMMQAASGDGHLEAAEARLAAALEASGESIALTLQTRKRCMARHDGLDVSRVLAQAGTGLARVIRALAPVGAGKMATEESTSTARKLCECASHILLQLEVANNLHDGHAYADGSFLQARLALGLAWLATGNTDAARRQHHLALRRIAPGALSLFLRKGSGSCNEVNFPGCIVSVLHLGLVESIAGNATLGTELVQKLLLAKVFSAEAAEQLLRFANAHAWPPRSAAFGDLLVQQASTQLQLSDGNINRRASLASGISQKSLFEPGQQLRLAEGIAALGAARLHWAGSDPQRWRAALSTLSKGRRIACEVALGHHKVKALEASYQRAWKLTHMNSILEVCPLFAQVVQVRSPICLPHEGRQQQQ